MFNGPFDCSINGRALNKELVEIEVHDIRSFSSDRHKTVDDAPYGGGPGMILMLDPIVKAVESIKGDKNMPVILLSPQGEVYNQRKAETLSKYEEIILICGHYEGIDYRITELVVTDELSIGDFVLSGGEFAAMVLIDSLIRLLPGALGNALGGLNDSHTTGFLQHPHYTRPEVYRGRKVPEILLSGNHKAINEWRLLESLRMTLSKRPDLIKEDLLSPEIAKIVNQISKEEN
tara:strand:- start:3 stop:701 length:699 start_codon:yes stop_codon:yes gene_type:complete